MVRVPVAALWVLALGIFSPAQERSLYWRNVDVNAVLDRHGVLHVQERQTMVFDGPWNGGERVFLLGFRQRLVLQSVRRVDPVSGTGKPLVKGTLDQVDRYDWTDSKTLRWRSRSPADPPFDHKEITYVLDYTLSNILSPQSGGYLLDHNFVFTDRSGRIEQFSLNFRLDPAWQPPAPIQTDVRAGPLAPGTGYIVRMPLHYLPPGRPAGVLFGPARPARYFLALVLMAVVTALCRVLFRRERELGRLEPLLPQASINEQWLRENVFSLLPEVVGAAWDDSTGAPEVAAVLARLVAEGKMRSEVVRSGSWPNRTEVLHLRLIAARDSFADHERELIESLFFEGDATDTDRVKQHYKETGFDPSSKIKGPLERRVRNLIRGDRKERAPSWKVSLLVVSIGILMLVLGGAFEAGDYIVSVIAGGAAVVFYIDAVIMAALWRNRVDRLVSHSLLFLIPLSVYTGGIMWLLVSGAFAVQFWTLMGLTVLCAGLWNSVLNMAKSREPKERIQLRKRLASARGFFLEELKRPEPRLSDTWYPYMIAFGLGQHIDRWFRAYGAPAAPGASGHSSSTSAGASLSSSTASGWSGGGGAFGGAGASASWAAAAGSLAGGVSTPGSSGGSGGGGGGSSGGGGGGGW